MTGRETEAHAGNTSARRGREVGCGDPARAGAGTYPQAGRLAAAGQWTSRASRANVHSVRGRSAIHSMSWVPSSEHSRSTLGTEDLASLPNLRLSVRAARRERTTLRDGQISATQQLTRTRAHTRTHTGSPEPQVSPHSGDANKLTCACSRPWA